MKLLKRSRRSARFRLCLWSLFPLTRCIGVSRSWFKIGKLSTKSYPAFLLNISGPVHDREESTSTLYSHGMMIISHATQIQLDSLAL
jgi:hypothetical protein